MLKEMHWLGQMKWCSLNLMPYRLILMMVVLQRMDGNCLLSVHLRYVFLSIIVLPSVTVLVPFTGGEEAGRQFQTWPDHSSMPVTAASH